MNYITGGLATIALLAIVIFSLQNLETIEVSFLIWSLQLSKVVVILGTYALGMVSGWGFLELVKHSMK